MTILFDTTQIKQIIQTHLQHATHSIEIAMAWFINTDLAAALRVAQSTFIKETYIGKCISGNNVPILIKTNNSTNFKG